MRSTWMRLLAKRATQKLLRRVGLSHTNQKLGIDIIRQSIEVPMRLSESGGVIDVST